MADETKKPQAPAPVVPPKSTATVTQQGTPGTTGRAGAPTPRVTTNWTPAPPGDPNERTSTSEWADHDEPPFTPEPLTGYGSKRIDIFPRLPIDPTNFLNLQHPGYGEMLPGFPGMIADKGDADKISRVPEEDIPFGALVAVGNTGDGYCKVATSATDKILGIAMRDTTSQGCLVPTYGANAGASTEVFPKDHWAVPIIHEARVWVIPTTAVHEGDGVGVGAGGQLSSVATGGIPGMKWATSAPANMLAQVQLNL